MRTVQVVADYPSSAPRMGIFIRPLFSPFILLYLAVYSLLPLFLWPFVGIQMFFTRRRSSQRYERIAKFLDTWARYCSFLTLTTDRWDLRSVNVKISYWSVVPRFELFFRPFYLLMAFFNFFVLFPFATIIWGLQWLHILLLGKRNPKFHRLLFAYLTFFIQLKAYEQMATDERPPLFPENVKEILSSSKGVKSLDE